MSLTNPNKVVTEERLNEYHQTILPYLGGMPEILANKFSKSDLYSTTEKMIGQWIDNKPLYQKTINFGALPNNTTKTVNHGISNIDKIVNIQAIAIVSTGTLLLNDVTGNNYIRVTANKTSIDIKDDIDRSSANGYVTLYYTKTTDSAVSIGVDTDYSTTEKIVGTWLDGKPVYEKTLDCGTLPNTTTKSVSHNISNLKNIVSLNGVAINNSGTNTVQIPLPYGNPSNINNTIAIRINGSKLDIITGSNLTAFTYSYVIIQYTKTTD